MPTHPNPPRPVMPGKLAVRPDTSSRGEPGWAIVCERPLHPSHGLVGYKRGYGESHAGLYAYRFVFHESAVAAARQVMDSTLPTWGEE